MNKNKNAVEVFNKLANIYQNKFMDVSLYSDTFDFFCNNIKNKHAQVLDIACGPGNITRYLLHKRPDLKITGLDLASNMIELAKTNNPKANFQLMDCKDISMIETKYDAIICGFYLPYLSKEEAVKLIADAAKLLNSKGLLYISTMEDEYGKSGFKKGSSGDAIFMHYHQADYLTVALNENQFAILNVDRKVDPMQDGTIITDLILIAAKL